MARKKKTFRTGFGQFSGLAQIKAYIASFSEGEGFSFLLGVTVSMTRARQVTPVQRTIIRAESISGFSLQELSDTVDFQVRSAEEEIKKLFPNAPDGMTYFIDVRAEISPTYSVSFSDIPKNIRDEHRRVMRRRDRARQDAENAYRSAERVQQDIAALDLSIQDTMNRIEYWQTRQGIDARRQRRNIRLNQKRLSELQERRDVLSRELRRLDTYYRRRLRDGMRSAQTFQKWQNILEQIALSVGAPLSFLDVDLTINLSL